jgi:hypothetical protein
MRFGSIGPEFGSAASANVDNVTPYVVTTGARIAPKDSAQLAAVRGWHEANFAQPKVSKALHALSEFTKLYRLCHIGTRVVSVGVPYVVVRGRRAQDYCWSVL